MPVPPAIRKRVGQRHFRLHPRRDLRLIGQRPAIDARARRNRQERPRLPAQMRERRLTRRRPAERSFVRATIVERPFERVALQPLQVRAAFEQQAAAERVGQLDAIREIAIVAVRDFVTQRIEVPEAARHAVDALRQHHRRRQRRAQAGVDQDRAVQPDIERVEAVFALALVKTRAADTTLV